MSDTFEVDDDGFVELREHGHSWHYLEAMRAERQRLDAAIERAEGFFRQKMKEAGATGLKIDGVRKVTFRPDATFPAAKYAAANPIVAAMYTVMKPAFDVERFKRDRPDEHQMWRGNSFKYVQPKKGS
jgi:hypothetical protein